MTLDVFTRADADPAALAEETVAVIGYGNLGSSMAKNLAGGGLDVVVGNRDDEYRAQAAADGFAVAEIGDAVTNADVIYVLISDEAIPACFGELVAPMLRPGSAVCFASGYCLAYGLVTPPQDVDVLLLAPRMVGSAVRRGSSDGYVAYVSVERDASGRARQRLLGLALDAGALDRGAFVVSAVDEAALDLFVEQSVGPYVGMAVQLAFEVGVAAGSTTRSARPRAVPVRRDGRGVPLLRRARFLPSRCRARRDRPVRRLPAHAEISTPSRCGRGSPPCSTTSAAADSPRSSRPRPPPAPRRWS